MGKAQKIKDKVRLQSHKHIGDILLAISTSLAFSPSLRIQLPAPSKGEVELQELYSIVPSHFNFIVGVDW